MSCDFFQAWTLLVGACVVLIATSDRPQDKNLFQGYLPTFDGKSASGWMDIICLASAMVLWVPFDGRRYESGFKPVDLELQRVVRKMYSQWRNWLASEFKCTIDGKEKDWEDDVFSVFRDSSWVPPHYRSFRV